MAPRDIGEDGSARDVLDLGRYQGDFDRLWDTIPLAQRTGIEDEINSRLDTLIGSPSPNWGSITNTSIEGGKPNPVTGIKGDWHGKFQPIYEACGRSEERAGMFFGNVWKKVIIDRPERWIGIRSDPTFPQRGISLEGKTYFLDSTS